MASAVRKSVATLIPALLLLAALLGAPFADAETESPSSSPASASPSPSPSPSGPADSSPSSTGTITGRVVDDETGAGVAGVRVVAVSASAANNGGDGKTADGGTYQIKGLEPGVYTIRYTINEPNDNDYLSSDRVAEDAATVTVEAGASVEQNIRLQRGGRIAGTLSFPDAADSDQRGYSVTATDTDDPSKVYVAYDAQVDPAAGARVEYALTALPPGTYTVAFESQGSQRQYWKSTTVQGEALPIRVERAKNTSGIDATFAQESGTASISGTVTVDNVRGIPANTAQVSLLRVVDGGSRVPSGLTTIASTGNDLEPMHQLDHGAVLAYTLGGRGSSQSIPAGDYVVQFQAQQVDADGTVQSTQPPTYFTGGQASADPAQAHVLHVDGHNALNEVNGTLIIDTDTAQTEQPSSWPSASPSSTPEPSDEPQQSTPAPSADEGGDTSTPSSEPPTAGGRDQASAAASPGAWAAAVGLVAALGATVLALAMRTTGKRGNRVKR